MVDLAMGLIIFSVIILLVYFMYVTSRVINPSYHLNDEIESCTIYFEDTVDELLCLEQTLSERYNLTGHENDNHHKLVELAKAGLLEEDEVVADWNQTYSSYLNWLECGETDIFKE